MRVVVVGAGGMGGCYAALLAHAGADVTLLARGASLAAIERDGLRIEGMQPPSVRLRCIADPLAASQADLVLLCVKSYDLEEAAQSILPLLHSRSAVLALQNGVEHGERLAAIAGRARSLAGASYIVAHRIAPGLIRHISGTRIDFGGRAVPPDVVATVEQQLRRAGIEATAVPNIDRALWHKFISIIAFGSINCLTRAPAAVWQRLPEAQQLVRAVAAEVAAVACARGIDLGDDGVPRVLATLPQIAPDYTTSMLADLQAGRRLELETLQGAIIRLATAAGVPVPHTFTVYATLRPFRDGVEPAHAGDTP